MIGRHLSVVTLDGGTSALSDNFIKVKLLQDSESRQIREVTILGAEKEVLTGSISIC